MFGIDPSKLDPAVLSELTKLIQQLPPSQIMKMQTLMHNMMAGHDVKKDMEEFERSLPPGFREKIARLMYQQHGAIPVETSSSPADFASSDLPANEREARMTILRAVASQALSIEDAYAALFDRT